MTFLGYTLLTLSAFGISVALTPVAIRLLPRFGFMDRQESHSTHRKPAPRGGGIVIWLTFSLLALITIPWSKHLGGLLAGGTIVFIINFIDDRIRLSPFVRLFGEIVAALIVIGFGIGMENITNPVSGEAIALDTWRIPVMLFGQLHYIVPLADLFTLIWIIVLINMMNWLDGLDGLASGVSAICALTLFGLSLLPFVNQPEMASMSLILVGALLGFLVFNFSPAKIKLGDAGSTFLGFTLAVLAIFSSGKIATFFLVLGLPLLDVAWVLFRRVFIEHRSPFVGDQKHFHHRLLQIGFSVRQTVLIIYTFCAAFGIIALTLQGAQMKLLAIGLLTLVTVIFGSWVVLRSWRLQK